VAGSCASARPNPDPPAAVQEAIPGWEIKVRDDRTSTDGLFDDLRYKALLSELKLPE